MKNVEIVDMHDADQGTENVKGGAAFLKLGDIKGEATDSSHKDWVIIESMSSPIFRSIPEG